MKKKLNIITFIKDNKKYFIWLVIILMSILSILLQRADRKNAIILNSNKIETKPGKIVVYITGEVKNPGVYCLDEDARLFNLIDLCGGLLDTADTNKINLAQKLSDSQKVNIQMKLDEVSDDKNKTYDEENEETVDVPEKININIASKEELTKLNGIGISTAQKIIDYRKKQSFNSIEEVMNVPGIGNSKFESIKDYICVN